METLKEILLNNFSTEEITLLHYFLLCFIYEISKFIIMFIFFSLFHIQGQFCAAVLVLLSIRNFYGGVHFNHYSTCFGFTFIFFATSLVLNEYIYFNNTIQVYIIMLCLIISYIISPITSTNRPKLSHKLENNFHLAGKIIISIYAILFITLKTFPCRNICFWVIVLQTLQLLAAQQIKKRRRQECENTIWQKF